MPKRGEQAADDRRGVEPIVALDEPVGASTGEPVPLRELDAGGVEFQVKRIPLQLEGVPRPGEIVEQGLDPAPETAVHVTRQTGAFDFADVTAALRGVYDPEIPINIVDLGLVYRCDEVALDDGRRRIEIDMTMTAPGCGMGDVIARDAESAVQRVAGVDEVDVTIVWDPPWTRARISEAARLELGLF